jgi:DNA-binding transcriptional LysR family regulator
VAQTAIGEGSRQTASREVACRDSGGDGEFRKQLQDFAALHGLELEILVECSSHAQAAAFAATGTVAAVLPESLAPKTDTMTNIGGDPLRPFAREIMLAWNPDRLRRMPWLEDVSKVLRKHFGNPLPAAKG